MCFCMCVCAWKWFSVLMRFLDGLHTFRVIVCVFVDGVHTFYVFVCVGNGSVCVCVCDLRSLILMKIFRLVD